LVSSLPLLNSSRRPWRWLGYATYGILIFFFLNIIFTIGYLSTIVMLMSSAPGPSNETSIEDALDEGAVAEKMGALGEAIYAYDRAIALNASCVEAWYKKGFDLERMGRYEEAIKCYDKVIELNKSFADAYINVLSLKGDALQALNRTEEASLCYDQAVEQNPRDKTSWIKKCGLLYRQSRYAEDLPCYDAVIELDPDDKEAWTNRCDLLDKQGNYDELLKCYDKLIELDQKYYDQEYYENPRDSAYRWIKKGNILFNQSKYDEAIRCYDRAIQIYPGGEAQRRKEEALLAKSRSTHQLVQEGNRNEGSEDEAGNDSDLGHFVGNGS